MLFNYKIIDSRDGTEINRPGIYGVRDFGFGFDTPKTPF
jgi:hypothetical protein